ncbi:hypothetical protein V501_05002 [Pseudogymnoascus sp. VKM F-4519 (FW-2642)]|nr:hypothetical protein V501_05002 [Pseudogymnoascus sp. VKM F-4519 (FW-2642)]
MQLYMHRGHVWRMRAQTACMIMLLEGLAAATPTINLPLNSQFPPVARVSAPFNFTLSESTFSSDMVLTYALSNAPSWLSLDSATRTLSGTPPDWASGTSPTLDIIATDGSGSISMRSTLIISTRKAPEITMPIAAQLQSQGANTAQNSIIFTASSRFSFSFSTGTFRYPVGRSTFTYFETPSAIGMAAVTLDNKPLPPWISFDNSSLTFSGETPDSKALTQPQERFGIRLIALDEPGFAGASVPFYIMVENHKLEWDVTALEMKVFVGKPFEFKALSGSLKLDGKVANTADIISVTTTKVPWLEFDNTNYVLFGTPRERRKSASPLDVTVSAQDRYGGTATAVIRVTLANNIFSDGDIASINATIGQPFSYNVSQVFVDPTAVDIGVSISPQVSWLSFDSKALAISGDVSKSAEESSINITMAATPKLALSNTTPDLKLFTINVVSQPPSTLSGVHTSETIETEDSTVDSNGLEATTAPTGNASRHGLTRGELAVAIILSIFAVIFMAGILLYCGRRQRNRFKLSDPIVPLSKRAISTPRLQKKFSILGLNGSPGSAHPGLRAKAKNMNKVTFDNPDPFSTKYPSATRQSASSSKYSDEVSPHLNAGHSGHKDFSRPFQGTGGSANSIDDDPDILIIQNFPSESEEGTKSHGITTAPSAVRTKGGAYSFHPYRTTPGASPNLEKTPEATCTTKTKKYRAHKRHRTPSDLGPLPNTPSKQYSSTGLQRTGSERSTRTVQPWSKKNRANGQNHSTSVSPVGESTWESTPGSPIKSSSARPRSSLSVVTESTDVLYLDHPSPTTTTNDSLPLTFNSAAPFTQPLQTFLDMAYSPPGSNLGNSRSPLSQLPSRRTTGSSPFFSGSHRTSARVQSRGKMLFGADKEAAAKISRRQAVPEPLALRKLAREENKLQALQDPGLAQLLGGLGGSRIDPAISSYAGSIEMTEDGTKRLISFLASVDKRKSWVSDTDSRKSFSAWDFEQEKEGPSEAPTGMLQRFKSYRSNVSTRSKTTFRGQSIWLGNEDKDARGPTFMEQMASLEYCGGLFGGNPDKGGRWARSQWSESIGGSSKRLSTPLSPKSFELGVWGRRGGNDGVFNIAFAIMPGKLPTRRIGRDGPEVPALGLGTMGLSAYYGTIDDDETRFKFLDRAYELGATFWDTADVYGDSEELIGKWFKRTGKRDEIFLVTKFGNRVPKEALASGNGIEAMKARTIDSTPEYCLEACELSLKKLGVDYIDLYYAHRIDGVTPIEKTMEALVKLKEAGKIKHIGLSEPSAATIRRAHAIHPLACVQMEYSPFSMDIESPTTDILRTCRELGISIVAYSPMGRGFFTGAYRSPDDFEISDVRRALPRFAPENFARNLEMVDNLKRVAEREGVTVGQLTLAWLLAQGDDILPIPGTRRVGNLEENLGALEVRLSEETVREIRGIVEGAVVVGERYPSTGLKSMFIDTPEL